MTEKFSFGVDIGGMSVKFGLFSSISGLLEKWKIPTDRRNAGQNVLSDIVKSMREHMDSRDYVGMGVGVPGPVTEKRWVDRVVNIGWGRTDLGGFLQNALSMPVICMNDANAAAIGEMWRGGGIGFQDMVLMTLGTGVGGGIILGRNIVEGAHGSAGELGHMQVEPAETRRCTCGNCGCLEYYASATGLSRLTRDYLLKHDEPSALRSLEEITARNVWDLSKQGDAAAEKITDLYCKYLGRGAAAIAAAFDPQAFIIGGGVANAGKPLIDGMRRWFLKYAFPSCAATDFCLASLGNDAGIYGCAYEILRMV